MIKGARYMTGGARILASLVGGAAILGLYADVAPADEAPSVGADIHKMCGAKPATVALVDGFGGNSWRKASRAIFENEAAKCPNITKAFYAEADNDRQKYEAAINSLVAQGVNVLVTFTDFGDATVPIARKGYKAGVTFIPYYSKIAGVEGKDYAAQVYMDYRAVTDQWADWLGKNLKKGNVVFLGGTPGAASSQNWLNNFKEGLKKYPDIKLLDENFVVTNWNPADAQRATAGLISKYGDKIDAVVSDYGVIALAAVKAFQEANVAVPPQATIGSFNELNCKYLADKAGGKGWKYLSLDYTNGITALALRRGLSTFEGTANGEPETFVFHTYADSETDLMPQCDPSLPVDADLSALVFLPKDKLDAVFRH